MKLDMKMLAKLQKIKKDDDIKTVFISHPFSNNPKKNRELVDKICKDITDKHPNILPISPLHLFGFLEKDGKYRDKIMEICYLLIALTDETWIYIYNESKTAGQVDENNFAISLGTKEVKYKRGI